MTLIVLALLAGPLAAAGLAKLLTRPELVSWPIRRGPLAAPHGQRIVGAGELLAAALVVSLPGRLAAAVAMAAYLGLTGAALLARGQLCACFGTARLAAVGRVHIGLNVSGAALGAVLLPLAGDTAGGLPWRIAALAVATAVTWGLVLLADRNAAPAAATSATCDAPVHGVVVYVADDCPSCRSLKHLLRGTDPARMRTVRMTTVAREAELPGALHGLGVPCAQGLDADGRPVCAPATGIGGVKALVDRVTITPAATGAR